MLNFKTLIIITSIILNSIPAIAGTILLLGAGIGPPSVGPPPVCSNSLDFSDPCNSQYAPIIF